MRQLSGHDATFLAMETGTALGHSGAVALLGAGRTLSRTEVASEVDARLPDLLCRRLAPVPLGLDLPYWTPAVPDLDHHIQEVALPPRSGIEHLAAVVAERHTRRLDRSRPLWELHLIHGVGKRQALYLKIHHAMVDGVGGNALLLALFGPDAPSPAPPTVCVPARHHLLARSVASLPRRAARTVRTGACVARELPAVRAEALRRAPATPMAGPLGPDRALMLTSLEFAEIRKVRSALAMSVNDVAVAVTAGALRVWLEEAGHLPAEPLLAAVPMSVRAEGSASGNAFALLVAKLATDVPDPVERARATVVNLVAARKAHGSLPATTLTDLTALAIPLLARPTVGFATRLGLVSRLRPFNLMLSTVAGPEVTLACAGVPIDAYYPISQVAEGQRLNVTMFGYNGRLHVGVLADAGLSVDPARLAKLIPLELSRLVAALPRDKPRDR